ncbi:Ger(x)C family spore germination protein [Paenibacillus sinopodophylli]|uniref:Ger(x)C family spore germination protein n=1 Tax=Paenibacillus sinopodophylli TaxID=1837342 RepID=UPI00110CF38B|nr:Ger(x)C family spore germination protein [Paenibacillus sinopodophylli]
MNPDKKKCLSSTFGGTARFIPRNRKRGWRNDIISYVLKKWTVCLLILCSLLPLSGCWSKFELTERGFVMGVAIDLAKNGDIELLTQIYRPTFAQALTTATTTASSINIKTHDQSVMEAIRDIPIHLGRKAQWSHLRVIIVGEKLARSNDLGHLLDLFYRDHEPRSSVSLMISKGNAEKMFLKKPLIEQTTAQQFLRVKESSYHTSAKTIDNTLLDLMLQLKSASGDALVAYVYGEDDSKEVFSAAGLALVKKGKMKVVIPASKVEGLLMLRNVYRSGVVEVKCPSGNGENETAEILTFKVKKKPVIKREQIAVNIQMEGDIAIGELKCTNITSTEVEEQFIKQVEAEILRQLRSTIKFLQASQMDVIGVADEIYRSNPRKWEQLKEDWDDRFAQITFNIKIKLRLVTSGTISSKPAG